MYRKFATKDALVPERQLAHRCCRDCGDWVSAQFLDDGGMLAMVREFVAGQLRREQHAGTIASDLDTDLIAELMVRISASFLTVPSRIVDISDDDQLATVARQFLVSMLGPRR